MTDDDGNTVTVTRRLSRSATGRRRLCIDAPTAALKNTNVTFKSNAAGNASSDLDGTIAKTEWDIDGDGFDDGTDRQITKSFPPPGPGRSGCG